MGLDTSKIGCCSNRETEFIQNTNSDPLEKLAPLQPEVQKPAPTKILNAPTSLQEKKRKKRKQDTIDTVIESQSQKERIKKKV